MRLTPVVFPPGAASQLLRDGTLSRTTFTGSAPNYSETVYKATLSGFDSQDNPLWGSYTPVISVDVNSDNQPRARTGWNSSFTGVEATTGGYYPVFQATPFNSTATTGIPHVGAMKAGFSGYAWTAMPETCALTVPDFHGEFPCQASYGGHNGISPVRVEGRNIFVFYDGQDANYGDQIYQFWEDGLMVGQFGNMFGKYSNNIWSTARPGQAENIRSFSTVSVHNEIFLYHSDEAWHGPVHRWEISNMSSIHEYGASGPLRATSTLNLQRLF